MLGTILLLLHFSFGAAPNGCPVLFDNGHNKPLQAVMLKMQDYEFALHDFVNGLQPQVSKYVSHTSTRNLESLDATLEIVIKYERLLAHLVEKAQTTMMSSRIEMKDPKDHESFKQNYQNAYVEYLALVSGLRTQLEALKNQSPDTWDPTGIKDTLRTMHSAMGQAHNRF